MHHQSFEIFQSLTKAGATPGEDFSFSPDDGGLRLTEHGYQILKQQYPQINWDSFTAVVERDPAEAVEAIHDHLGTNFVGNILDYITRRIRELPEEQAAWYLSQVLAGVEERTGIALYELLSRRLSLSNRAYIEHLLRCENSAEPCSEWINDLVLAAGGTPEDVEVTGHEALLTEHGMRLLATVWIGEYDLYAELARVSEEREQD
ncbi:MAG: hypothetical protein ACFE0J_10510 [Elainellaceae cyanobacterium]